MQEDSQKPMVQSDEVFKASRFSGLELLQKTGRGRRKGKGTFAITFNSTIKRYYALIIQAFLDPLRPMILVKTVVHRGTNIFFRWRYSVAFIYFKKQFLHFRFDCSKSLPCAITSSRHIQRAVQKSMLL